MLWFRTPEKVYFKKGCMPVALNELKTEYNRKKAFIVTDSFLFKSGFTKNITDKLDELGIQYACFYDVAPDPTLGCAWRASSRSAISSPMSSSPWAAALPWTLPRSCG